ncbi:MAG: ATP-binding protein, partial [Eubacteriales bacterium]|nr:ATP-binding protein [Eubacteriales bacterium]
MNHLKLEQKRQLQKIKIITWITCVISTVMVCMSLDKVSDYKGFVLQILLCLIGTIATFHKKVSVKKASYYFLIWLFINNMTSSLVERQIYAVIIVLILNIILFEGFQDRLLVFLHCAGSVLLILYHFLFENTFNKDVIIDHILVTVSVISIASGAYYSMTHIKLKNKMERQLYDSVQDAKVAEREKTAFLANMSHEIRTPMNAIIGMCELMLREPDCSDSAKEYGAYIQNAGSNLLAIVNDVLDYSKIESGKMEILEEEFNLASVVNDVVNMITMRIGGKDLELIVHVDPEIPNTLMGDEIRLRQVIINLLTNAVKYTREGAVILTISFMRRGYGINLNVSVKDTGIGISPENLEKLFSSFQQVDTKRNRAVEGTGLGLALSKKLIMQMGGFINVS